MAIRQGLASLETKTETLLVYLEFWASWAPATAQGWVAFGIRVTELSNEAIGDIHLERLQNGPAALRAVTSRSRFYRRFRLFATNSLKEHW
jgi:hypothetical protein